ncbi:MAG TPA: carboxypeptidase-like regulatory domain-containing protein [Candidatus Angelobacter sp.]
MRARKTQLMIAILIIALHIQAQDTTQALKEEPQGRAALCSLRGVVVTAGTGLPLKAATVILVSMSPEEVQAGAEPGLLEEEDFTETTDSSGHFVFDHVPAGNYVLRGSKPGFISATYHSPDGDAGARIELKPGNKVDNLQLLLTRGAVIFGRITDEDGEPAAGVQVDVESPALRRDGYDSGHSTRYGMTNDLGEYRIYGLPPGRYYVTAADTGFGDAATSAIVTTGRKKPRHTYPRIFYPGVFRITEAEKIRVRAGQEVHIDFLLKREKLLSISGQVLAPNGKPAANARISLQENATIGRTFLGHPPMLDSDAQGNFLFQDVLPGTYTLTAALAHEAWTNNVRGEQKIELAGENLSGVQLRLSLPLTIAGKVTLEPGSELELDSLEIILDDPDGYYAHNEASVKPDGTFLVQDIRPPLSLAIPNLPIGLCVLSAIFGTQNVLEDGLFLGPEEAGKDTLQIRIGVGGARIEGVVLQGDDPVPNAVVKLFQISSGKRNTPVYTLRSEHTRTTKAGHFVFADLSPGRYRALAYAEDDEDGSYPEGDATFVLTQRESRTLKFKLPKTEE